MFKVVANNNSTSPKTFATINEVNAYATRLLHAHRSFDVFKNGNLIATCDGHTIYNIPKKRSVVRGSVGYATMMEKR